MSLLEEVVAAGGGHDGSLLRSSPPADCMQSAVAAQQGLLSLGGLPSEDQSVDRRRSHKGEWISRPFALSIMLLDRWDSISSGAGFLTARVANLCMQDANPSVFYVQQSNCPSA